MKAGRTPRRSSGRPSGHTPRQPKGQAGPKATSQEPAPAPDTALIPTQIVAPLAAWFLAEARDLPWRAPDPVLGPPYRDPYRSLVSELMLQQTQVSRVEPKFNAFMERFPNVAALASASEQDVLAAWAGLGYYRRARLLHAAAKRVVEAHGGRVPRDAQTLRTLPGVGRYTAGAVASMACGQGEPIVDANVARVLVRVAGVELRHATPQTLDWAWMQAQPLAASAHARQLISPFNEGLMELGATVCTPSSPKCERCPIARWCVARAQGRQDELPLPKPRQERRSVTHVVLIVRSRDGKVLMERRGDGSTWAGLWQFATVEVEGSRAGKAQVRRALALAGLDDPAGAKGATWIAPFDRTLSHRHVRFEVFECGPANAAANAATNVAAKAAAEREIAAHMPAHAAERRWVRVEEIAQLPLTTPQGMIARALIEILAVPTTVVRKSAASGEKRVGKGRASR